LISREEDRTDFRAEGGAFARVRKGRRAWLLRGVVGGERKKRRCPVHNSPRLQLAVMKGILKMGGGNLSAGMRKGWKPVSEF